MSQVPTRRRRQTKKVCAAPVTVILARHCPQGGIQHLRHCVVLYLTRPYCCWYSLSSFLQPTILITSSLPITHNVGISPHPILFLLFFIRVVPDARIHGLPATAVTLYHTNESRRCRETRAGAVLASRLSNNTTARSCQLLWGTVAPRRNISVQKFRQAVGGINQRQKKRYEKKRRKGGKQSSTKTRE